MSYRGARCSICITAQDRARRLPALVRVAIETEPTTRTSMVIDDSPADNRREDSKSVPDALILRNAADYVKQLAFSSRWTRLVSNRHE